MRQIALLSIILVLNACASKQLTLPPDKEFIGHIKKVIESDKLSKKLTSTDSQVQAKIFLKARHFESVKNIHHACQRYRVLKKNENFPLRHLAFIKALELCAYPKVKVLMDWKKWEDKIPKWLRKDFYKVSRDLALKHEAWDHFSKFSILYYPYLKIRKEKEELLLATKRIILKRTRRDYPELTSKIYELSPRLNPDVNDQNRYEVARDFERKRKFKKARRHYWKIVLSKTEEFEKKVKAYDRIAMSYKNQRDKVTYAKFLNKMSFWLHRLVKKEPKNKLIYKEWIQRKIDYSRGVWTNGELSKGRRVLLKLLKNNESNGTQWATIYWVLANMSLEAGNSKEAIHYLTLGNIRDIDDDELKRKISWALGWNHFLLGNYEKSSTLWRETIEDSDSIYYKRKLKYWEAESLDRLGKKALAYSLWENIFKEDPFGYYGIISNIKNQGKFHHLPTPDRDEASVIPELEWLISMGETGYARTFMESFGKSLSDVDEIEENLPNFVKAGYHDGGIWKFYKVPPEDRGEVLLKYYDIVFPQPFNKVIAKNAKRYKVDSNLIKSIIRQESTFNPVVRSWADAFGLMQLTPERAAKESKKWSIPYKVPEDLYRPEINVPMGTALLKELIRDNKGNLIKFVASYNANQRKVKIWFRERFDGDYIKFIENIPYEETRNYVKLVSRNFIIYRRMNSKKSFKLSKNFFKKALTY